MDCFAERINDFSIHGVGNDCICVCFDITVDFFTWNIVKFGLKGKKKTNILSK